MKLTLSEQTHDSTLEVNTARTVSLGMTESPPKYVGARAYVEKTEEGYIITLSDYEGTTQVEVNTRDKQLTEEDFEKIQNTISNIVSERIVGMMKTDIYDKNQNDMVDNSEKVNGHTVETDVPQGAVFTDTIYEPISNLEIDRICDL